MRGIPPRIALPTMFFATMRNPQLFLPDHVFACFSDDYCVFLDLKRDKYLCTERNDIDRLLPWLRSRSDLQRSSTDFEIPASPDAIQKIANNLLDAKLLTRNADAGKCFETVDLPNPQDAIGRPRHIKLRASTCLHLKAFIVACTKAHFYLTRRSLEYTIRSVARRKNEQLKVSGPLDTGKALPLIREFNALRLCFPREYLCMFDSLALVEFLSIYDLFPTWVFGVRAVPFSAHCWVQDNKTILNDTISVTGAYVPIMAV